MIEHGKGHKVIIAIGDRILRKFVGTALHRWRKGITIEYGRNQEGTLRALESGGFSLLIVDRKLLPEPALPLESLRRRGVRAPIVMMCDIAPKPYSLEGLGPIFVLLKPFGLDDLKGAVEGTLPSSEPQRSGTQEARHSNSLGRPTNGERESSATGVSGNGAADGISGDPFARILGRSPKTRSAVDEARRVASFDATVVLLGQSGTGKELVARAIHRASGRADGPFVAVNSAALAETLLESELFGHERGAFTGAEARKIGKFEHANGGTIFLDEVGDMSSGLQARLLRVLQERSFERVGGNETLKVDVRLIAATNRDLKKLVAEGKFRDDLFWRLNVVAIRLPTLAERPGDIPVLAQAFLRKFAAQHRKADMTMAPALLEALRTHLWPGNVRELENVIERMVVVSNGPQLEMKDLSPDFFDGTSPAGGQSSKKPEAAPITREAVATALAKTAGNRSQAAKLLGIGRRYIQILIRKYSLA